MTPSCRIPASAWGARTHPYIVDKVNHVIGVAAVIVLSFSLTYFTIMVVKGVRFVRRSKSRLRDQEQAGIGWPVDRDYAVYFLIAALNEAQVIGETVRRLIEHGPDIRVILVDDGSDDGTGQVAATAGGARVRVLRRELPNARQGKGEALNAGFATVAADVRERGLDPRQVLLCVMDADGRLSRGVLTHVTALFADKKVGGVQLSVRIRNTGKLITRFQDMEFWMISALTQFGRVGLGTVSLGGNGQFTRLAAILELGERPWSRSLTEDLDLSISLNVNGWRTVTTPMAYVDQQGVTKYRALVRQRVRWYQGTMQCAGRIPQMWRSRHLSNLGMLELSAYVLVPWAIVLPWSFIQHWLLVAAIVGDVGLLPDVASGTIPTRLLYFLGWYVASFLPNIIIGVLYGRRTKQVGTAKAFVLGHLMLLYNYVGYGATFGALWRILRRRNSWAKTARVAEVPAGRHRATTVQPGYVIPDKSQPQPIGASS